MQNWIGIVAGIFTSVSLLPQLFKMIKEKKPSDVSIWMFLILLVGVGLWIVYGIMKQDWPIIITNSFSFLANLTILVLHLVYKSRESAR